MSAHHSYVQYEPEMFKGLDFNWAVLTDTGLCRDKNEDAFLIEPEIGLFLVSDGMGGHPGGDLASDFVASNLSVLIENSLHSLRSTNARAIRRMLKRSIRHHSNEVRWEGQSESGFANMGATVVLCLLIEGRAYAANLGDSRLYRLRKNNLTQISRDHSVVNELIEAGKLEPEMADEHNASGQITQYMGMDETVVPFIRSLKLYSNDRLLLCSDGLTDMLSETEIKTILQENPDPQKAAKTLVEQANKAGGYDNITVAVIDWF